MYDRGEEVGKRDTEEEVNFCDVFYLIISPEVRLVYTILVGLVAMSWITILGFGILEGL